MLSQQETRRIRIMANRKLSRQRQVNYMVYTRSSLLELFLAQA